MDLTTTYATVPTATFDPARLRVAGLVLAPFGDGAVRKGKGINVCTDARTAPGIHAWSPPS